MVFRPKFIVSDSIKETARLINLPHEDFPKRVDATQEMLELWIRYLDDRGKRSAGILTHELKNIHSHVMWDLEEDKGTWRTCNVRIGHNIPPHFLKVEEELNRRQLLTIKRSGWSGYTPWLWYKEFQEVHPFRDGNGRVGGIVLAFLTYDDDTGTMLAPCQ